jgi:hypothetical protein
LAWSSTATTTAAGFSRSGSRRTARSRETGEEEWSCTFHAEACEALYTLGWDGKPDRPDDDSADGDRPAEGRTDGVNGNAVDRFMEVVDIVVATARELGAVEGPGSRGGVSGNILRQTCGLKRDSVYAAIDWCANNGRLKNLATKAKPAWVVPAEGGDRSESGDRSEA